VILAPGVTISRQQLDLQTMDANGKPVGEPRKSDVVVFTFDLGDSGDIDIAIPAMIGKEAGEAVVMASSGIVHASGLPETA
jgi:hypothetical protein